MIELETLRVLKTIIETGSFAKAADKLHRVQSAITYRINKLEKECGEKIFDRSGYRAQLTDFGHHLVYEAEALLAQQKRLTHLINQYKTGWETRLQIVVDGILPIRPILGAISQVEKVKAPTSIQLSVSYLAGVQKSFDLNKADIMLVKEYKPDPLLHATPLPPISTVLVTSKSHPLAKQKNVQLSDLRKHNELLVKDHGQGEQISTVSGQALIGKNKSFYLGDFSQKKEALLMGLGFGWMPSYLIAEQLMTEELILVDYVHGNRQAIETFMVTRESAFVGKSLALLIESLKQQFQVE